jgi:hypothetical protein
VTTVCFVGWRWELLIVQARGPCVLCAAAVECDMHHLSHVHQLVGAVPVYPLSWHVACILLGSIFHMVLPIHTKKLNMQRAFASACCQPLLTRVFVELVH